MSAGTDAAAVRAGTDAAAAGADLGTDDFVELRRALRNGVDHLLSHQDAAGWWKFALESNTAIDAEDLLMREYLGIRDAELIEASARYIRSRQRPDGSWPQYHGGAGELSTTVESYIALRLAGDDPAAAHMAAAASWARQRGGIPATRVFTRIWLALFGWWPWEHIPVLPPEIMLLPRRAPLSIYSFASWARQTIVPLTIVSANRPVRPAPFDLPELFPDSAPGTRTSTEAADVHADPAAGGTGGTVSGSPGTGAARVGVGLVAQVVRVGLTPASRRRLHRVASLGWKEIFEGVDSALHLYHRRPVGKLRRLAIRTAEQWIIARQEADGCFGGIQPPAIYAVIALTSLGYQLDHPVIAAALRALDEYAVRREDGSRVVEASQSPVWDTALAIHALADAGVEAGVDPGHPALVRAADWLLGQEITEHRGDWALARPDLTPSGWAFEFENDTYPDTDDTAEVVLALRRVRHPAPRQVDAASHRAATWLFAMQSRDGGWGAYDADNTSGLPYQIPFADFGALTDPPSADVTAHVVEMLAELGLANDPRTRRGVDWLLKAQEADGSWYGRWGVNYVYGVGSELPALRAAGLPATHPAIRAAARWLLDHQNADGGWGEDVASYEESDLVGRGASTPSQTAWAMLGLQAPTSPPTRPSGERCGWPGRSGPTAAGTRRSSPGPASPGTSTSTTTATGWSGR